MYINVQLETFISMCKHLRYVVNMLVVKYFMGTLLRLGKRFGGYLIF